MTSEHPGLSETVDTLCSISTDIEKSFRACVRNVCSVLLQCVAQWFPPWANSIFRRFESCSVPRNDLGWQCFFDSFVISLLTSILLFHLEPPNNGMRFCYVLEYLCLCIVENIIMKLLAFVIVMICILNQHFILVVV